MNKNPYDVIIIGAGPAGLTAGIYCGRYMLKTLIIEKLTVGGQITLTSEIENYPGAFNDVTGSVISEGKEDSAAANNLISGLELTSRMRQQAEYFGAEFISAEVAELKGGSITDPVKEIILSDGAVLKARAVIIAGGAHHRPIGCKNEEKFVGSGISYCAVCDANFFKELEVYVVGGGESALKEAMHLARAARHVTVIHRRDRLKASELTCKRAFDNPKISFIWDSEVTEALGDEVLEGIRIRNLKTGEEKNLMADEDDGMIGLFGFTGMQPETDIYKKCGIRLDGESGYIIAGEDTHTNIDGIFAAGDIRTKRLRQVVTACADGAAAAAEADSYLK